MEVKRDPNEKIILSFLMKYPTESSQVYRWRIILSGHIVNPSRSCKTSTNKIPKINIPQSPPGWNLQIWMALHCDLFTSSQLSNKYLRVSHLFSWDIILLTSKLISSLQISFTVNPVRASVLWVQEKFKSILKSRFTLNVSYKQIACQLWYN